MRATRASWQSGSGVAMQRTSAVSEDLTKRDSRSRGQRGAPAVSCVLLASFGLLHSLQHFQRRAEILSIQRTWQAAGFQVTFVPALPVQPSNSLFGKSAQLL